MHGGAVLCPLPPLHVPWPFDWVHMPRASCLPNHFSHYMLYLFCPLPRLMGSICLSVCLSVYDLGGVASSSKGCRGGLASPPSLYY